MTSFPSPQSPPDRDSVPLLTNGALEERDGRDGGAISPSPKRAGSESEDEGDVESATGGAIHRGESSSKVGYTTRVAALYITH